MCSPPQVSFHRHSSPFTLFDLPSSPFLAGNHHAVVCAHDFFLNPFTFFSRPRNLWQLSVCSLHLFPFVSLFCSLDSTRVKSYGTCLSDWLVPLSVTADKKRKGFSWGAWPHLALRLPNFQCALCDPAAAITSHVYCLFLIKFFYTYNPLYNIEVSELSYIWECSVCRSLVCLFYLLISNRLHPCYVPATMRMPGLQKNSEPQDCS